MNKVERNKALAQGLADAINNEYAKYENYNGEKPAMRACVGQVYDCVCSVEVTNPNSDSINGLDIIVDVIRSFRDKSDMVIMPVARLLSRDNKPMVEIII